MSTVGGFKYLKAKEKDYPNESVALNKLISIVDTRLDF